MSRNFEEKARSIVLSNLSDENFGASELSSLLGLSSSQTLRRIKAITGKSVSRFISDIRLEEAANLIQNTDLSFSEISYKVGFSSPSYFNKVFSKHYGLTPGEFKERKAEQLESSLLEENTGPNALLKKRTLVFLPLIAVLLVAAYFIMPAKAGSKGVSPNSIAVLPFKDFSPKDSRWFSDGISDNILHTLAQMEELSVISFTSSSTYRDTDKKIPEIAQELGVSYVLEGSVTLVDGEIKVITQLIDANDKHIWSKEYSENFNDLITVQNSVAQEVVQQMEVTISPEQDLVLNEYPTDNIEAYSLYLKGRLLEGSRTKEDLESVIDYNMKAIALDSSFAMAYGEIAFSHMLLAIRFNSELDPFETRDLAKQYADKALSIDPHTIAALRTLGVLNCFVDWDKAEAYIEKAIAISPNDATLRNTKGLNAIYHPKRDKEVYLSESSLAVQLNPLSPQANHNFFVALMLNNRFTEAEDQLSSMQFLYNENRLIIFRNRLESMKMKDWSGVKKYFEERISDEPDDPWNYLRLANYYRSIEYDYENAIGLMEQAYSIDSTNLGSYVNDLIVSGRFEEAEELMNTDRYEVLVKKADRSRQSWSFHYHREDYQKALLVLEDSVFNNRYWRRTLTYASMGERQKMDSMNHKYPWGTGLEEAWYINRAVLHAAIHDRDSMYYYLEKIFFISKSQEVNFYKKEFDPYRHEERFKAYLKKWYLPVPE